MERLQFDINSVYEIDEECIKEKENTDKKSKDEEEVNYFIILFCLRNI
ncbi:MAG: hypothetical protein GX913_05630 [Clostridiales bacterium]|mgnify:CR=1 FL=1|nr:hypothetical protein [Clostridiales bacterium]